MNPNCSFEEWYLVGMRLRINLAVRQIKKIREAKLQSLWALVDRSGEWKVEVLNKREDPFYVTQCGKHPLYDGNYYSTSGRQGYEAKHLKLIDTPAKYRHLL